MDDSLLDLVGAGKQEEAKIRLREALLASAE